MAAAWLALRVMPRGKLIHADNDIIEASAAAVFQALACRLTLTAALFRHQSILHHPDRKNTGHASPVTALPQATWL
jgi:hypothetical protein